MEAAVMRLALAEMATATLVVVSIPHVTKGS
jgi:hypothetical protein